MTEFTMIRINCLPKQNYLDILEVEEKTEAVRFFFLKSFVMLIDLMLGGGGLQLLDVFMIDSSSRLTNETVIVIITMDTISDTKPADNFVD